MRKKLLAIATATTLGVSGLAVAVPALADTATSTATAAAETDTARVDRLTTALAGLVTDGTLTQAQADQVASTLAASDALRGGGGDDRGPGRGGRGADLAAAATALGTTEADLRTALQGGQTLAQVATGKGVDVDTLVAALVEAERTRIASAVTDGTITQAKADERLAGLTESVTDRVNSTRPSRGERAGRGGEQRGAEPAPSTTSSPAA